jgi:hypothetical protein
MCCCWYATSQLNSCYCALDSGASHSFISKEFPEYYHIPSKTMHTPLIAQSPGLENRAEIECEGVKLEIGG